MLKDEAKNAAHHPYVLGDRMSVRADERNWKSSSAFPLCNFASKLSTRYCTIGCLC